ncbi:LysR family transcriptional regulator [Adlercreutzia sp. R21]|uniref:LysR family transcriptional regulator n=1 Tax=Adlercreutzia wanghongyangiae TaxID=3111451 RepID=A0ABU6IK46_9ACTN|nr:LysR family transcriptional regulator [Adlercreutzia sp. R21]MEC4176779.1 LysR family transcriptional regulator [Adlercreutzia sp. R7]MEC4184703.1 LysR family transcriptional regulator [Adlercreutzia sp. R21]
MRLSYLREFVTLASYTKLTAAARALHMSPSTLSQHLAAIEREIGCELFSREGGFALTREGETALEHAQKIMFEYNELLRDCAVGGDAALRLSFPEFDILEPPIAAAREAFLAKHPGTKVILSSNEYDFEDPLEVLEDGLSDVSILFLVRGASRRIESTVPASIAWARIGSYHCVFARTPQHPTAGKSTLSAAELDRATVIAALNPVSSIIMEGVAEKLAEHRISIQVLYKRILRNSEAFLKHLDDEYVFWLEPMEGAPGDFDLPDYPCARFEGELIADAYLLYRPSSLNPLQREYLDLVSELYFPVSADQ